jgi:hypothetical protein
LSDVCCSGASTLSSAGAATAGPIAVQAIATKAAAAIPRRNMGAIR